MMPTTGSPTEAPSSASPAPLLEADVLEVAPTVPRMQAQSSMQSATHLRGPSFWLNTAWVSRPVNRILLLYSTLCVPGSRYPRATRLRTLTTV